MLIGFDENLIILYLKKKFYIYHFAGYPAKLFSGYPAKSVSVTTLERTKNAIKLQVSIILFFSRFLICELTELLLKIY